MLQISPQDVCCGVTPEKEASLKKKKLCAGDVSSPVAAYPLLLMFA